MFKIILIVNSTDEPIILFDYLRDTCNIVSGSIDKLENNAVTYYDSYFFDNPFKIKNKSFKY